MRHRHVPISEEGFWILVDGNDVAVAVAARGKACDVKIAKDMAGTRKIRRESERYGGMKD